jgi:hypothetical protein
MLNRNPSPSSLRQLSVGKLQEAQRSFDVRRNVVFLLLLCSPMSLAQTGAQTTTPASRDVSATKTAAIAPADAKQYLEDIKELTTPEMEGRGAGTKGIDRAKHVIVERYKKLKLQPAGTEQAGGHAYEQEFTVTTGAQLKGKNALLVRTESGRAESAGSENLQSGGQRRGWKVKQDFVPYSFSQSGEAQAPVVFAGYGISADEHHYDDYAGLDVKGKVVVVLRYEPPALTAHSGNGGMTRHSQIITKAINARNHGAKALVLVNGKLGDGEEDLLTRFGSVSGPADAGILFVQAKNDVVNEWLKASGKSLAELQKQIDDSGKPASFALAENLTVEVTVNIVTTHAKVNNVLAYLPGKTDQYVIIGAHYDHLGRGNVDSLAPSQIGQIHPGADDNGSGTAGVLALARMLAPHRGEFRRGILFINFAGEELGLLGSAYWVKNPTLPLEKAVAMINMDMIGRIQDDKVYVGGIGTGSTLKAVMEAAQKDSGFKIEYSPGGYASSDHTSFVAEKIPVLFFFSGLHSDYHKPSDTWDKINADAAAKLLSVVASAGEQLADADQRPVFQEVVEEKPPEGGRSGYGPYFGSIPDFGEGVVGVRFSDVKPGSPAAKAGLKAGDILVQFNDKPIKNLYDFTDALRRSKIGEVVEVKVVRDGQKIDASVKLEQRK